MSTTSTQSDPSRNPTRKRRRRRSNSGENNDQNTTQGSSQRQSPGKQRRRGSAGKRQQSTRRSNASRGSGGVYKVSRTGGRPIPALWRRILQTLTFGLFRADPYFVPGSERFARTETTSAPSRDREPKTTGKRERRRREEGSGKPATRRSRSKEKSTSSERSPEEIEVTSPRCFVGNLSYDVTEEELQQLFAEAGSAAIAELVINSRTGKSKGYGFVTLGSIEEAQAAVARFHDHEIKGRKMIVSGAKSSGPKTTEDATEAPEPAES